MLKYVSKFAMDILPSVAATIIGAYIVNHYIAAKPGTDAPVAAAASSATPKKVDLKVDAKAAETSSDVANLPEAGVRAKGISEKAIFEKSAVEKPARRPGEVWRRSGEKSADKPAETASIPVDTRRHQPAARREKEKTAIRTIPLTVQPAASAVAPVVAAPNAAPAVEAAIVPEEHRDANDLARAAIERLRGVNDGAPRAQDAVRIPDATRMPDPPRIASAPPVRPLPPPIMVSTSPAGETFDATAASTQTNLPYPGAARIDDPRRPIPPADIPESRAARSAGRGVRAARRANTPRLPRTCCRLRNRCFTRSCRNSQNVSLLWPGLPPTRAKPLRAASSLGRMLMARPYEPAALVLSPRRS